MTTDNREVWITCGYEIFATSGPGGLKIEPLAKRVGKSKSSFYHHFADLDLFIGLLVQHHIRQSRVIAQKEHTAETIDPELIDVLMEHRVDLFFNRQLRIHRNVKAFSDALRESDRVVGDAFVKVWVKDLGLQLSPKQIESIFSLALENFYLQINADNLNRPWLAAYFTRLKEITRNLG